MPLKLIVAAAGMLILVLLAAQFVHLDRGAIRHAAGNKAPQLPASRTDEEVPENGRASPTFSGSATVRKSLANRPATAQRSSQSGCTIEIGASEVEAVARPVQPADSDVASLSKKIRQLQQRISELERLTAVQNKRSDELETKAQTALHSQQLKAHELELKAVLARLSTAEEQLQSLQNSIETRPTGHAPDQAKEIFSPMPLETRGTAVEQTVAKPLPPEIVTKLYHLQHLSAAEMRPYVQPLLTPSLGSVSFASIRERVARKDYRDPPRAILVKDTAQVILEIDRLIMELDRPPTNGKALPPIGPLRPINQDTLELIPPPPSPQSSLKRPLLLPTSGNLSEPRFDCDIEQPKPRSGRGR